MSSTFDTINKTTFQQNLAVSLTLKNSSSEKLISSNNINAISLNLSSFGYSAKVEIQSYNDNELDEILSDSKVISSTLSFLQTQENQEDAPSLLELNGTVISCSFQRCTNLEENIEQSLRIWKLEFKDNAQAIWSEHHPQNIYINKTMKDVFSEHKNSDINLVYDWQELETPYPILSFSLEEKRGMPSSDSPNFYSFLHWYLHQENGIFTYDYQKKNYTFSGQKDQGSSYKIYQELLTPPLCQCAKPIRFTTNTLSHQAEVLETVAEEVEEAFLGTRCDFIDRSIEQLYPEHSHGSVKSVLNPQKPILNFGVKNFHDEFQIDKLLPGSLIEFHGYGLPKGYWSEDPIYSGQTFRTRSIRLDARRLSESRAEQTQQLYSLKVDVTAEYKEEKHVERAPFASPTFPFPIQGEVYSEIGASEQTTFYLDKSEGTPLGHYEVKVPLALGEKLVVPFFPEFMTGQHFYPLCKNQQVLLEVYFRTAKIKKILDWQPHAKLPDGTQGNQLVLASNGAHEYVILRHEYEGGSNSVYTLIQSSSLMQTQTTTVQKESIKSTVELEGKKITTIEQTNDMIHYRLEDKESGVVQETIFDGTQMKHSCKKRGEQSVCIQTAEGFSFSGKNFSIDAKETISFKAETSSSTVEKEINMETKIINLNAPTVNQG